MFDGEGRDTISMIPDHSLGNLKHKRAFASSRCMVLATGWITSVTGIGQFYSHYRDERVMTLAAIYSKAEAVTASTFALVNVVSKQQMTRMGFNSMSAILSAKEG